MATDANGNRELVKSALLAGFISGFIWMAITVLVGFSAGGVVGGGFVFLIGTAAITYFVARGTGGQARR